jgi:hypothetical protein
MTAAWREAWLWLEGEQARGWTAEDTQLWPRQKPALLLERIRQQPAASLTSLPVRLHLTEDWPAEEQRAFYEAIVADPTRYAGWQVLLDVPRTAAPPVLPPRAKVVIADLWPDAERHDGQSPPLFKGLLKDLPDAVQWCGVSKVERELRYTNLSGYSLLVIIAHGSERSDALPFRLADQGEWDLPPGLRLPPLVLLLACGNADHHLVDYGRRLLRKTETGVQTVLAPTGRLDARPADRFLRDFLHGWPAGQRVDELLWRAQQQPDSAYGAGRLVILGRGDLHIAPPQGPAEWADTELQQKARALTPESIPALQALLERLTWQSYLEDGDLEGVVDALYEALGLVYDDREKEQPLLELLKQHAPRSAPLTQHWVLSYCDYLAEIYDHRLLSAGGGQRLAPPYAPHAWYHDAKRHYRQGKYPAAVHHLAIGLRALPLARWPQRSGLGLLGVLVNTLIDLNLPEPAQAALDQLDLTLSRASSTAIERQTLNHWDRRARLALRQGRPEIALGHYRQKRLRDRRDPDRELAWLLYVAAWADLPEGPDYAAEVRDTLHALYSPDYVFGRGNETPAYLLRALALWAWRSGDAGAAAQVAVWTAKLVEPLGRVQDPGPFAMTLGYLHLYAQNHAPVDATLPDWTQIADALEREHYWFERASLASLLGCPTEEIQRALDQFQALRVAAGVALAGLPEPLQQQMTTKWPVLLAQREAMERALLWAGAPADVAHLVKKGLLPL